MDLIPRTSYAKDMIRTFKEYFESGRYNGDAMDCADMFRHSEWKIVDDVDYAINTREDLVSMATGNPKFKMFIEEVIECMKYNRDMEEKC